LEQRELECPKCGAKIDKQDKFCPYCGANLEEFIKALPEPKPYERKFGLFQRLYGVIFSPEETLRDIALAPDYEGPVIIIATYSVLLTAFVWLLVQRITFTGQYASFVSSLMPIIILVVGIVLVLMFAGRWLIKSLLVQKICDQGSSWSFKCAAAVTGYVYMAELVLLLVSIVVTWYLFPSTTINLGNFDQTQEVLENLSQRASLVSLANIPITAVRLVWKSLLGGIGTYYGTNGKCSRIMAFGVFLLLSLIPVLWSFLT